MGKTTLGLAPATVLKAVLWLASVHSAAVGVGLILHPAQLLGLFGYHPLNEPFFPVQGGVFHLIMALGYGMGAHAPERQRCLIVFAVIVKSIATVFLMIYWVFVSALPIVLLSAIGDGMLAGALGYSYAAWRRLPRTGGQ